MTLQYLWNVISINSVSLQSFQPLHRQIRTNGPSYLQDCWAALRLLFPPSLVVVITPVIAGDLHVFVLQLCLQVVSKPIIDFVADFLFDLLPLLPHSLLHIHIQNLSYLRFRNLFHLGRFHCLIIPGSSCAIRMTFQCYWIPELCTYLTFIDLCYFCSRLFLLIRSYL